ncbi:YybS family protein [Bacillus marinisedimentorum]|uniref:YybS family protein n=1 Tax=Bacillus marinisedimentorum TaxID=1821260 RepID=UPI000871C52F|nr:YybS family protein [Bacillus marinisedimentorum]
MKSTRVLTEGAVLLAIYAVLLGLSLYLPVVGPFLIVMLPVPFVVYVVRHDLKAGIFFGLLALVITALIGTVLSLPATFLFGSAGLVMGYLYKKEQSAFSVLIGGTLAYIAGLVLTYALSTLLFNLNPIEEVKMTLEGSMEMTEGMLSSLGQDAEEQMEMLKESFELMQYLLPTVIVTLGIILAVLTQSVSSMVLKRLKYSPSVWPPFREWRFPRSLIWYYLLAAVLMMVGLETGSAVYVAVLNVYMLLQFIITVQGFSFIFFYFHAKNMSKGVPIVIVIFSFLLPAILLYLVRILGIIDLGFDLRKKFREQ